MLRDEIFNAPWEKKFFAWYRSFFSIGEIENSTVVQWVFGATLFSHFVAFNGWFYSHATTIDAALTGTHRCWPYFQSCGDWLFLRTLPEGYSQPLLYMLFFALMLTTVYCMYRRDWVLAHLTLMPAFMWHTLVSFVLTYELSGNYDYYLFAYSIVILFLPHKYFFLKLSLVLFYFLSTAAKIHEGWVLGTYFSALKTGLPLFPDWSIPVWTNLVIGMEMVGAWFLLGKAGWVQRSVFLFFVCFHLYSGLLVGYHYPATALPTLIILFGPFYTVTPVPLDRRALYGWIFIGLLGVAQLTPQLISGDEKLTMEGNRYGLYMFDANHQCVSRERVVFRDGTEVERSKESYSARKRCDPYVYWFVLKQRCLNDPRVARIEWQFDHSINGGPFYRIVEESDACALEYQPFKHNAWIKREFDAALIQGLPVENLYH